LRQKAVRDILRQFFNIQGEKIDSEIHQRNVAFPLEELWKMKNVISVAGGKSKVPSILGALWGRFIKILINDEETVKFLLDNQK